MPHASTHQAHGPDKHVDGEYNILNWSLPGQNYRHLADDIFKCIFMNEEFCSLIKISLKYVP